MVVSVIQHLKVCSVNNMTHHFKVARSNNKVVDDIVDLCDQGQDGRLNAEKDQLATFPSLNTRINNLWLGKESVQKYK